MSYLDIPRIHFSGQFSADPSTLNNNPANYSSVVDSGWNANGKHWFYLKDCKVQLAIGPDGAPAKSDPVMGGVVDTTNIPAFAKLVDLDPNFQTGSQIWGAEIRVSLKAGGGTFTGKLQTCGLRDLWMGRTADGFAGGFGGTYQSVFKDPTFTSVGGSPVLQGLSARTVAIKFVVYAYDANPASATFTFGKIVGSIGPFGFADGEDGGIDLGVHFLQARRMSDAGSGAFGNGPFKLNPGKKKLTIDLGNCIPEVSPAGARQALGDLTAVIVLPSPTPSVTLGKLDYSLAHYLQTAGVEELTLTDAQVKQLQTNALGLMVSSPAPKLVMSERPKGLYVDVTEHVFRIEPGETADFSLVATEFGAPKSGLKLNLLRTGSPAAGLTVPTDVTTAGGGAGAVSCTAGDPGNPRGAVDGQLYKVNYFNGPVAPSNLLGVVCIHVYDKFTAPASVTYATVKPILDQYARLFPFMKGQVDLSSLSAVKAMKDPILQSLLRPLEHPGYMPVTRDLSPSKSKALQDWLKAGVPDGLSRDQHHRNSGSRYPAGGARAACGPRVGSPQGGAHGLRGRPQGGNDGAGFRHGLRQILFGRPVRAAAGSQQTAVQPARAVVLHYPRRRHVVPPSRPGRRTSS